MFSSYIPANLAVLLLCSTFLTIVLKKYFSVDAASNFQGLPLPPGPKQWPIIGNLFDAPQSKPWITFRLWGRTYGDIISFRIFHETFIVLNSRKIAVDLFEKRSRIYSDRPDNPLLKLSGWDYNTVSLRYGPEWRAHRRIFNQKFKADVVESYQPIQLKNIHTLLRDLLEDPGDFMESLKTFSASIIMYTVYGHQIAPKNDRFVQIAEEAVTTLSLLQLRSTKAIYFQPVLRYFPTWFPGTGLKAITDKCKKVTAEMQDVPFALVKNYITTGSGVPSLTSDLLQHNKVADGAQEQEIFIKRVAATAYSAGADTTSASTATAILAMVLYPEAQKKAQEEIDQVIGTDRLPDYADRRSLPYIEAFYREVMRWHPITPLATWHSASESDIYEGIFIPKGAYVAPNIWAMTRDEEIYPSPEVFRPERFLTADGNVNDDSQILTFSMGRRICPGRHMADTTVWAAIACLLATFDFGKAKDKAGNYIDTQPLFDGALISHPQHFECSITPRSQNACRLVQETVPLTRDA